MNNLILYILIGKLLIFLIQKFPFSKLFFIGRFFGEGRFLEQLFSCDLCLGVWVYTFLAFFFGVNYFGFYFIGVTEFLVGATTSFIMHLITIGWIDKFGTFILE